MRKNDDTREWPTHVFGKQQSNHYDATGNNTKQRRDVGRAFRADCVL